MSDKNTNRPVLETMLADENSLSFYLEDVSTKQFAADVRELMAAYSDGGAIDRAIEMLQSLQTKQAE